MGDFVQGIASIFTGGAPKQSDAGPLIVQANAANAAANDALNRQQQELDAQKSKQEADLARLSRVPRGRRLLLAATGDAGVTDKLGG